VIVVRVENQDREWVDSQKCRGIEQQTLAGRSMLRAGLMDLEKV